MQKVVERESAATEERQWVRLNYRCNNHCIFCHDAYRHDGKTVAVEEILETMRGGRERGATRLILSGGEPTIHPGYLDLIRHGRALGYTWIQTVTNGRMFSYDKFVARARAAGLDEVTVSMHGHTPELHDRLVGIPNAFNQAMAGLENLLAAGLVVSVDVVVNKENVRHLRDILEFFIARGIHEFDLLHLIPFGRGFDEHRDLLFYDPATERPYIHEALSLARRPDLHLWTNRWPPPLLEGVEELIQDPHKIQDEVRGGYDNFSSYMEHGVGPECRGERCSYCFLERFCQTLFETRERLLAGTFEVVVLGADRARALEPGVRDALARQLGARWRLIASTAAELTSVLRTLPRGDTAELEIDVPGLRRLPRKVGTRVRRAVVRREADLAPALGLPQAVVEIPLERGLLQVARAALKQAPERVLLTLPGRELLSETLALDASPQEIRELAAVGGVRAEGVAPCLGIMPQAPAASLDAGVLRPDGTVDLFAYVHSYVKRAYLSRSLRCEACHHAATCHGAPINYVRGHGFGWMEPQDAPAGAPES